MIYIGKGIAVLGVWFGVSLLAHIFSREKLIDSDKAETILFVAAAVTAIIMWA